MQILHCALAALSLSSLTLVGCATTPTTTKSASTSTSETQLPTLDPHDDQPVASAHATMWVYGMSCPKCVSNIDVTLKDLVGVTQVQINMAAGIVQVGFSGDQHPTPRQLANAVDNAGLTLVRMVATP